MADYGRLIILNNTNFSKTYYWDSMTGIIDFGVTIKNILMK
jgi:hypothetical protein